MKRFLLASLCLFAVVGCGGSGSNGTAQPQLAGEYEGRWVNIEDPADSGISSWTIGENGSITGTDVDDTEEFFYTVFGETDDAGNVDATTSLVGEEEVISLTGRLQFDSQNRLTGELVWNSVPPLTYRYTFTRSNAN